jgi:hypothetical protein
MAMLHPINQVMMKKEMKGSELLKDFFIFFPPI